MYYSYHTEVDIDTGISYPYLISISIPDLSHSYLTGVDTII